MRWTLNRITAPAAPLISLDEAAAHLRLDAYGSPQSYPDQDLVEALIQSVTEEIDGRDGWLGRALVTQEWRLGLDCFLGERINIPLPPLQSVVEISYLDQDGVSQIVPSAHYSVVTDSEPGIVVLNDGYQWPSVGVGEYPVQIRFVAGYGDPDAVPQIIKSYAKLMLGMLYEHREMVLAGSIVTPFPYYRTMLSNYRLIGYRP